MLPDVEDWGGELRKKRKETKTSQCITTAFALYRELQLADIFSSYGLGSRAWVVLGTVVYFRSSRTKETKLEIKGLRTISSACQI